MAQRFRNEEKPVEPIQQTESGGDPKCHARISVADQPANDWAESEPDAKGSADQPESSGAFFPGSDVGDVGHRGGNTGSGDSGNDAAEKEPANGRRERHHDVIETEPKAR